MIRYNDQKKWVLTILLLYRGLLYDQLSTIYAYYMELEDTDTFRRNFYKVIQRLSLEDFVYREWFFHQGKQKYFIQLTTLGHETISEIHEIIPGAKGTGYGLDFGDFPYDLHCPVNKASSPHTLHHLFWSDIMFNLRKAGFQCRDNRYCSVSYEFEEQFYTFRPDGDVVINNNTYLLEVDRYTESLEALQAKFDGFDRYFKRLKQQGRPIPSGVIVVVEDSSKTGLTRRWLRFLNAYFCKMKAWYLHFNLIFCTLQELDKVMESLKNNHDDIRTLYKVLPYYINEEKGISKMRYFTDDRIVCDNGMRFVTVRTKGKMQFYGFEQMDFYETRALARLYELYKYVINTTEYREINEFIPVLYGTNGTHVPLIFKGFDDEETLTKIFAQAIYLKLIDEQGIPMPYWTDRSGNKIPQANPFLWVPQSSERSERRS